MPLTPGSSANHLRHHHATLALGHPFGSGAFGAFAEAMARFFGTPVYLVGQSLVVAAWVAYNAVAGNGFDPYPFILLNLVLSCLAAIQAPIILMSQNRAAQKDREHAHADYEINLKAELEILALHEKVDELRERAWRELITQQERQIELLERLLGQRETPR